MQWDFIWFCIYAGADCTHFQHLWPPNVFRWWPCCEQFCCTGWIASPILPGHNHWHSSQDLTYSQTKIVYDFVILRNKKFVKSKFKMLGNNKQVCRSHWFLTLVPFSCRPSVSNHWPYMVMENKREASNMLLTWYAISSKTFSTSAIFPVVCECRSYSLHYHNWGYKEQVHDLYITWILLKV